MRVVDKSWRRTRLGFTFGGHGFPRPRNITSITGPHPILWWRKYVYYKRDRRRPGSSSA